MQFDELACRGAFMKFFGSLLGPSYLNYRRFPEDNAFTENIDDLFDTESFIASRPKHCRKFLSKFLTSQSFERFVEDITYPTNPEKDWVLKFFNEVAVYEDKKQAELNNDPSNSSQTMKPTNTIEWMLSHYKEIPSYTVQPVNNNDIANDYEFPGFGFVFFCFFMFLCFYVCVFLYCACDYVCFYTFLTLCHFFLLLHGSVNAC